LNCIAQLLERIPHGDAPRTHVQLPKRSRKKEYDDQKSLEGRTFVTERY
jgi:hypothetical protein